MSDTQPILSCVVRDLVYGIPASAVVQVVPLVAITPVAGTPEHLLGVINVRGETVPVISMRQMLGFPGQTLRLTDRLIIATVAGQLVALLVDAVNEVHQIAGAPISELASSERGHARMSVGEDGFVQILDLESLLRRHAPEGFAVTGYRVSTLHG